MPPRKTPPTDTRGRFVNPFTKRLNKDTQANRGKVARRVLKELKHGSQHQRGKLLEIAQRFVLTPSGGRIINPATGRLRNYTASRAAEAVAYVQGLAENPRQIGIQRMRDVRIQAADRLRAMLRFARAKDIGGLEKAV